MQCLKNAKISTGAKWVFSPPMRQDAHADGAKRPEVEKLIIVYNVCFSITYTLHHAVPTRFKAFDIVSQGGADLKDRSEFDFS